MVNLGDEYPKAAYRLGGEVDVWGRMMDIRSLTDAQDEQDALLDGWVLHPLEADSEPLIAETFVPVEPRRRGRPPKVRVEDAA